jgi:hypothetical protein
VGKVIEVTFERDYRRAAVINERNNKLMEACKSSSGGIKEISLAGGCFWGTEKYL